LEEAVEVAQAGDVSQEQAMAILQRTYSRPIGEINKEIGGLLVTIYAFCGLYGSDPRYLLEREVERVLAKDPEVWRKKHAEKVADGTAS
jgi:NTP pyrophosphatase (non-canonical NTP hydrolase)